MKKRLKILLVSGSLLVAAAVVYVGLDRPTIHVHHEKASVVVDVQTLGEYPTTVSHVRLTEVSSGKIVLELLRKDRTPQITAFPLVAGENPVDIVDAQYGTYSVVTPYASKAFLLRPGEEYELAMWGTGWLPDTVRFQIQ